MDMRFAAPSYDGLAGRTRGDVKSKKTDITVPAPENSDPFSVGRPTSHGRA